MDTQLSRFLAYCESHAYFKARQAENSLGFGDARKKISLLRKQGYIFSTERVATKDGHCNVYHLEGWSDPNG